MKIIKRNQLIILVISLMLITAGYLNFTDDNNTIATSYLTAELGDATLVSSNAVVEENIVGMENSIVENNTIESYTSTDGENTIEKSNTVETVATEQTDDTYFTTSKLERENMYSQMLESYQKILESETISETQKAIAQTEIQNINETKNKIMICENLIKTKGIEDLVIFVNDKSISVVIRIDELKQEQIAQIQNIIAREMQTEITNIHISNK